MPFHLTEEGISQSQTARIHLKISPLSGLLCLSSIMCFFLTCGFGSTAGEAKVVFVGRLSDRLSKILKILYVYHTKP